MVKNVSFLPNLASILVKYSEAQRNQHGRVHQCTVATSAKENFLPQSGWDVKGSEDAACKFARLVQAVAMQQLSDWELMLELWTVGRYY